MREAMREATLPMFHRFTAGDLEFFWGVLFVWLFLWVVGFCLVFCFPRFRDLSSCFAKLDDRLSCHGAHGMGEKKAKDNSSRQLTHVRRLLVQIGGHLVTRCARLIARVLSLSRGRGSQGDCSWLHRLRSSLSFGGYRYHRDGGRWHQNVVQRQVPYWEYIALCTVGLPACDRALIN